VDGSPSPSRIFLLVPLLAALSPWGVAAQIDSDRCFATEHLSAEQRSRADSILAAGLDNEALFTLLASAGSGNDPLPLKPMSSLDGRRLPVARPDSVPAGAWAGVSPDHPELQALEEDQAILRALQCGPLQVVMTPFRITREGIRNLQIVVVHTDRLDQDLRDRASFWGQWGFVPGVDPATLVTVVEFEEAGDRFRGYGYLFGYPDHAVDFFVEAAGHQARTGDFVERDFFQIPVHSRETGRFVYAVPKGHVPLPEDEAILAEAARTLARYRELRPAFTNADGTLRAVELLRALYTHATPSPDTP
jgi:hypothetical protein